VFQINVAGQLFATQAAVAAMSRGGRIMLTSSVSARIAVHHHTLYAASKAAVSAMVLSLAPELAERGIAINAIAPGATATDMAAENTASYTPPAPRDVPAEAVIKSMTALGRLAEPDEIASVAAFFAVTGRFVHHRRHHRHRRGMDLNAPNSERRVQRREDEPQC
jgi:3-oxoacyl-[acyl-carrier protein] reductase